MPHLLIFGLGYTAGHLADRLRARGWIVTGVRRAADAEAIGFAMAGPAIASATHILSSVPPEGDRDPVLDRYGEAIRAAPARWIGYLSSSGVYGDTGGAWVDESAPIGGGRRGARAAADAAWRALDPGVRVFRLPGIYGPARSPLESLIAGRAHRVDVPGQMFSRVHVEDIVSGIVASFTDGPAGAYNLADDRPVAQAEVVAHAAALLGIAPPPFVPIETLSPAARGFYAENRRVANGRAKRLLGWAPRFTDYRAGLADCLQALRAVSATTSPAAASTPPAAASTDQR